MPDLDQPPSGADIVRLQNAIRRLNGCESGYVETVTVSESFQGFNTNQVWQAEVAVFEISGHPDARRAYAWSVVEDGQVRHVVVLEVPPVTSPQTAVQAAIAAQIANGTCR